MDRRQHKRYRLRDGAIAICSDQLGPIKDIGAGGLAFQYTPTEEPAELPHELDILMANSAFRIQGLKIIPVNDFEIVAEGSDPSFSLRQRGVRFVDLAPEREALVCRFIEANFIEEVA